MSIHSSEMQGNVRVCISAYFLLFTIAVGLLVQLTLGQCFFNFIPLSSSPVAFPTNGSRDVMVIAFLLLLSFGKALGVSATTEDDTLWFLNNLKPLLMFVCIFIFAFVSWCLPILSIDEYILEVDLWIDWIDRYSTISIDTLNT